MFRKTFVLLALAVASSHGFVVPQTYRSTAFVARTMSAESHMDKTYTAGSGMTEHEIPLFIENLTADNFEESLEMLEPLLVNECVGDVCEDYVGQLQDKAAAIGKTLPKGYAASHH